MLEVLARRELSTLELCWRGNRPRLAQWITRSFLKFLLSGGTEEAGGGLASFQQSFYAVYASCRTCESGGLGCLSWTSCGTSAGRAGGICGKEWKIERCWIFQFLHFHETQSIYIKLSFGVRWTSEPSILHDKRMNSCLLAGKDPAAGMRARTRWILTRSFSWWGVAYDLEGIGLSHESVGVENTSSSFFHLDWNYFGNAHSY